MALPLSALGCTHIAADACSTVEGRTRRGESREQNNGSARRRENTDLCVDTPVCPSRENSRLPSSNNPCHSERVIKLLYLIVLIADNVAILGCVGTVQANCANFRQFRCYKSLGHDGLARPSFEFVCAEFFRPFAGHLNGERGGPHRLRRLAVPPVAEVFDQFIVGDESQRERPRRLLDQNEHQCRNLGRGIALDGLASRTAKILAAFHIREILAEI